MVDELTAKDVTDSINHIESVISNAQSKIREAATCQPSSCDDCDFLRLLNAELSRITPEHFNTLLAMADKLGTVEAGEDLELY